MPAGPANLTIRVARRDDLPALDEGVPTKGVGGNADRLERSLSGASSLLLALVGDTCVGRGEVMWTPKEDAVRAEYPDVPELNGLDVPEAWRSRGIGTALLEEAADLARERGCTAIGLGVGLDNEAAYRLYARLGFTGDLEYVDQYTIVFEGVRHDFADPCRFLLRPL
jgi:GNAT superfamily N-acetyltransferase